MVDGRQRARRLSRMDWAPPSGRENSNRSKITTLLLIAATGETYWFSVLVLETQNAPVITAVVAFHLRRLLSTSSITLHKASS